MENFEPIPPIVMTPEDQLIVHNLKHVAFMVWLIEARDGIDYKLMHTMIVCRGHTGALWSYARNHALLQGARDHERAVYPRTLACSTVRASL